MYIFLTRLNNVDWIEHIWSSLDQTNFGFHVFIFQEKNKIK